MRRPASRLFVVLVVFTAVLVGTLSGVKAQKQTVLRAIVDVQFVSWVTGPESPNKTNSRFDVDGADLGSMFTLDNTLYIAFGDTFGCCRPVGGGAGGDHWRFNTLAYTTDQKPDDGIVFDSMITDGDGKACAVMQKQPEDVTIIPTYGIGVRGRLYLHYMAVGVWGTPGAWTLNRSGWAYSDDKGRTWTQPADATWKGDTNFGQAALVERDGYVYVFGIHGGRFGGVALARVPVDTILKMDTYQYWDGRAWIGDLKAAAIIASAPVGELSVAWNDYLGRWIMTYLDETRRAIVIRESPDMTGPWSAPLPVVSGNDYPSLYGAYLHPWASSGDVIYFNMSQWGPYNVRLMHARLVKDV